MSLIHQLVYINKDLYTDKLWENISYHPLRINCDLVPESNIIKFDDDLMLYFFDYFNWIEMYIPAIKKPIFGFAYHGITSIHDKNLIKFQNIINSLIQLFKYAPNKLILRGSYVTKTIKNKEIGNYENLRYSSSTIISTFTKLSKLIKKAINSEGYIYHLGI